jgi:hypothetical protein
MPDLFVTAERVMALFVFPRMTDDPRSTAACRSIMRPLSDDVPDWARAGNGAAKKGRRARQSPQGIS